MFNNIGKKIKTVARVYCWIGIVLSLILGAFVIAYSYGELGAIIGGLLTMAFGSLGSWVSSFLLYAFGQLVDNSDKLLKNCGANDQYNNYNAYNAYNGQNTYHQPYQRESVAPSYQPNGWKNDGGYADYSQTATPNPINTENPVHTDYNKIKCPKCGMDQNKGDAFCTICGEKLN